MVGAELLVEAPGLESNKAELTLVPLSLSMIPSARAGPPSIPGNGMCSYLFITGG